MNNRSKSSAVKGWKKSSPKLISQRRSLIKKCGKKCFLSPKDLKFPICKKNSCEISCKGLVSAKVRANQFKYRSIAKRADKLINSKSCTKKVKKNN